MPCSMADGYGLQHGLWLFSVHHELEVESAADAELAELLKRSAERDQPVVRTLDDRCVRNISCLIHRARSSSDIESPAELSRRVRWHTLLWLRTQVTSTASTDPCDAGSDTLSSGAPSPVPAPLPGVFFDEAKAGIGPSGWSSPGEGN